MLGLAAVIILQKLLKRVEGLGDGLVVVVVGGGRHLGKEWKVGLRWSFLGTAQSVFNQTYPSLFSTD
jgi:hypothetical protein